MRLIINLITQRHLPYGSINKHTIQGFIYSLLTNTEYENLHEKSGFKFFTFSDIFPTNDFFPNKEKTLIISSPNKKLIKVLYNQLKNKKEVYLREIPFRINKVKKINLKNTGKWITGSPIVLYKDNKIDMYFSFKRGDSISFFLRRIKENAIKKYNAFYNEEISLNEPIFDRLFFNKEVAVSIKAKGKGYIVIGSMWKLLEKRIPRGYGRFYRFLMDCGLGEKNSIGFGFVNPIKEASNNEE